jgi:hypothetical protein
LFEFCLFRRFGIRLAKIVVHRMRGGPCEESDERSPEGGNREH